MEINFEDYLHKFCRIDFLFSGDPKKTMDYEGVVEAVNRDSVEEEPHIVLNARYAGRVPIQLSQITSIQEVPSE